jgi:carboxypeptidase Taq
MAAHESQSLILEMQACLSDPYLAWLAAELNAALPGSAGDAPTPWTAPALARAWRRIERSLIRVEADEMTYPAHVILRFRLEQALVSGDLAVPDLPGAWSDGLHALLGIRPPDDRQGCLQDIHWFDGLFGYFPSYTLGAMAAAQLMAAARADTPGLDDALGRGDLSPLLAWLRTRIHAQGARLGFNALLQSATGRPLDPAAFETHLAARYL